MNTLRQIKTTLFLGIVVGLFAWGCNTSPDAGTGTMQVKMHDAPVEYDEVNISVERVEVNRDESGEGWETISEPNEVYNILELVNGDFAILADAELETGTYQQIRLILSDNNSVVIDGESYPLTVPSGAQTGLKLNINAEIEEGIVYTLLLDFDANRSVVKRGTTNEYNLRPVVRATPEALSGNIAGTVSPVEARAAVYAIAGSDTLSTTFADTTSGEFTLVGLEDGLYTVSVEAREDGYDPASEEDVEVTIGETNNIGEIELTETE
ncbi:MAG: DUF4382 domain-containing protein [Balneolaceae bacterium]